MNKRAWAIRAAAFILFVDLAGPHCAFGQLITPPMGQTFQSGPPRRVVTGLINRITNAERHAIINHVRSCWNMVAGATHPQSFGVSLIVATDATGTARFAEVAVVDQGKLGNPVFDAFANDAISAVLNYECAILPLPPSLKGRIHWIQFEFTSP